MSAHVTSRLSAFLDRELTESEAGSVRRHVTDCEACAARLREMEGVDRAFAEVPMDAPSGYFDSFAARVRSRIEAAPAAAPPGQARPTGGLRLPTWAWAVAAALLLGVLLPRLPGDRERPRSRAEHQGPAAPPPPTRKVDAPAPPEPAADRPGAAPRGAFAETALDSKMAGESVVGRRLTAAPTLAAATPAPGATTTIIRPQVPEPAMAPPARAKPQVKEDTAGGAVDRTPGVEATDTPGAQAHLQVREEGASVATSADEDLRPAGLEKREAAPATPPAPGAVALGRTSEAKRRDAPSALSASGPEAPAAKRAPRAEATGEFEALVTRPAETLADLRRLREAWRSFLRRHGEEPRADEARVAVVAVSVEIALQSRASEDEAEARRSGEAYLARQDAGQKARVEGLLARLPEGR